MTTAAPPTPGAALVLEGAGVRLALTAGRDEDGDPGVLVEVYNDEEGTASLVLEPADVAAVRDHLDAWLTAAGR